MKNKRTFIGIHILFICAFISLFVSAKTFAQNKPNDIIGTWNTGGDDPCRIQIFQVGDKYYGKIVWLKFPTANGKAKVDNENPDQNKRNQPLVGLQLLKGFKYDGDGEWKDGTIYDPESGKTYDCNISMKDKKTLAVRGYVGMSLFGRTETWVADSGQE